MARSLPVKTMRLPFTKMHGLGNDFVVVRANGASPPSAEAIRALADRKTGIGFDQLPAGSTSRASPVRPCITASSIPTAAKPSNAATARDASPGLSASGRVCALVLQHRHGTSRARIEINELVSVEIAVPQFEPSKVPFIAAGEEPSYRLKVKRRNVDLHVVSLGNPHGVLRVDDVDTAPVATWGPALEGHERFPNRANIGFMQVLDPEHIRLRVFERGVGETRACGTGACAAVVVGRRAGWLAERVVVGLPGGELIVRWEGLGSSVWLTGEAVTVFEGTVEI